MKVYFTSMSGNVRRYIEKLTSKYPEIDAEDILNVDWATEPFILVTYTIGFGEVPEDVAVFLEENSAMLRAVAVSGDRIWGDNFGKAGVTISRDYDVPLLLKFEKSGMDSDVIEFYERAITCDI